MILHELYANCEKRADLPIKYATRILRFNDPLQRDVLSTRLVLRVKKAIFSREMIVLPPREKKKLMIFCHSSAAVAVPRLQSMNAE